MALEHTFLGTWEIVSCTFESKREVSGLEGIKFRLDDTSDITWYNDLVSPLPETKDCDTCCDSASVLFSCETFDVHDANPRLIFGAFAGHSIEFSTNTLTPTDTLVLSCENWYDVECKRLQDGQAAGQEKQFSFGEALHETYFSDVVVKSASGMDYALHASILRLTGFDCSMCANLSPSPAPSPSHSTLSTPMRKHFGPIRISVATSSSSPHDGHNDNNDDDNDNDINTIHGDDDNGNDGCLEQQQQPTPLMTSLNLSPIFLQPPCEFNSLAPPAAHRLQHLSSSFNCLSSGNNTIVPTTNGGGSGSGGGSLLGIDGMRRGPHTSHSDSHLETTLLQSHNKNIFNFCHDLMIQPTSDIAIPSLGVGGCIGVGVGIGIGVGIGSSGPCGAGGLNVGGGGGMFCGTRRPPLSPFRARSPSPFPSSMDTPPSSPLTPVGVLYNLPTYLLSPILHWLYTESLLPELEEHVCEKLINFAETQPSLTKLIEPTRKYLRLMRLKKFVVNITMDLHGILNRVIQAINPVTICHEPAQLYATFQDALRECAIGCAKVLQFCNIFIKDATSMARYQKNEIAKYVRTRIPIFMSQVQQLLRNILGVFVGLTVEEKAELVTYLVPEIESTLMILTAVIEEIKNSLETMCKELKCSHLDLSIHHNNDEVVAMHQHQQHQQLNQHHQQHHQHQQQQQQEQQLHHHNHHHLHSHNSALDSAESGDGGAGGAAGNAVTLFNQPPLSPRPRRGPPPGLTLYENPLEKQRLTSTENDLKFVLYMYEVRKMRDIYGRISAALDIIKDKKTTFCDMDFLSKRSTINQNLEQLIVDIPAYIFIVENLSDRLDDKLGWKEFKFCFKLATSQINGVIVKLLDHKSALSDAVNQICKLVRKQEFTQSLIELGLLNINSMMLTSVTTTDDCDNNLSMGGMSDVERKHSYDYKNIKLNLIRHLCEPPIAANSSLSKNALRLLHSAQLADMEFEVHTYNTAAITPGGGINSSEQSTSGALPAIATLQVHTFKAHRVIVAARCEWFKKALMSGMQESINRKVIITDTSPVIFRRLLLYLYGAPIDKTVGAEQICELMLLADRYSIDDLKELCENTLNSLIDEESVVCLLGIADRYMATALKTNCLSYLSQHANLTKSEIFKELPQTLQLEVMDLIHWFGRVAEPWNDRSFKPRSSSRHSLKSPSKPHSRSRKSSPSYI